MARKPAEHLRDVERKKSRIEKYTDPQGKVGTVLNCDSDLRREILKHLGDKDIMKACLVSNYAYGAASTLSALSEMVDRHLETFGNISDKAQNTMDWTQATAGRLLKECYKFNKYAFDLRRSTSAWVTYDRIRRIKEVWFLVRIVEGEEHHHREAGLSDCGAETTV